MSAAPTLPVNYWPDNKCAKAFWGQRELPPYQKLLEDTVALLEPKAGQRWIDLGCGGGHLSRALWEKSKGTLAEVVALDCAGANVKAIQKLCETMSPPAPPEKFHFQHADFSNGLNQHPENTFDGATSGLAIHYAESYSAQKGSWTTEAYDRLLGDVHRVLKPGGVFIFSVNVPEPSWGRIAVSAISGFFTSRHPIKYLKNAGRMWQYGAWLKKQARIGRFHYLPFELVKRKLHHTGFDKVECKISFAKQAYIIRCTKPR